MTLPALDTNMSIPTLKASHLPRPQLVLPGVVELTQGQLKLNIRSIVPVPRLLPQSKPKLLPRRRSLIPARGLERRQHQTMRSTDIESPVPVRS